MKSYLLNSILLFSDLLNSRALGIILTVFLAKLFLIPFAFFRNRFMLKMKKIQPEISRIKSSITDSQERDQKVVELYKENKVNVLEMLIPVVAQFFFMASFLSILRGKDIIVEERFLIWELFSRDPYFILPVLNATAIAISTTMNSMDSGGFYMKYLVPFIFIFLGIKWSVAFHISLLTLSLISFIEDKLIKRYLLWKQ